MRRLILCLFLAVGFTEQQLHYIMINSFTLRNFFLFLFVGGEETIVEILQLHKFKMLLFKTFLQFHQLIDIDLLFLFELVIGLSQL